MLALLQAQRLEELQDSLAVPYDAGNLQHQQQLQELWALAFPELPFSTLKHNQWKEMGWQVGRPVQKQQLLRPMAGRPQHLAAVDIIGVVFCNQTPT